MTGNDPIDIAARALNSDEARILAHYANNENAGDIAITLEMDRNHVVRVIREKGRDNRTYSQRVALAWQQRNRPPRPSGALLSSDIISPSNLTGVPGLPAALRAGPPAAASAAKAVARTMTAAAPKRKAVKTAAPPPPEPPVEETPPPAEPTIEPTVQEEEPNVTLVAPAPAPAPARAEDLPLGPEAEHMAPDHNLFQCQHPDCRRDAELAGRTSAEPTPAGPVAEPAQPGPSSSETFERLLERAEQCGNTDVALVARNLRADLVALLEAVNVVDQAAMLEERIAVLTDQIDEKTKLRDQLRAELEALMSSGVMVSVASGHLRKPVSGDPDDATLREWGLRNSFQISPRGRVPGAVLIAYRKAHGLAAA